MPKRDIVIKVSAEPVEITPGEWCPTCALPSALRVDVAITIDQSLRITTWHQCRDCHNLWLPE